MNKFVKISDELTINVAHLSEFSWSGDPSNRMLTLRMSNGLTHTYWHRPQDGIDCERVVAEIIQ